MEIKVVVPNAWLQIDVRLDEQAKLIWLDTYCEYCEEDNVRLHMTEHYLPTGVPKLRAEGND